MDLLAEYLYDYFDSYLIEVKNLSSNTIDTYKYSFIKLFIFFKEIKNIDSNNIRVDMLNILTIEEFISWMNNQNLDGKTINNRITAIKELLKYISKRNPKYLILYTQIKEIDRQRTNKKIVQYYSDEEINILFEQLNYRNKKELKVLAILTLLYECALRVSELCNLKIQDVNFQRLEVVILNGKGNKSGVVPITHEASKIIQLYITTYQKQEQDYLFTNNKNEKYTRWGIDYILKKTVNKAKNKRPDLFRNKMSPHKIRHSRAMSLLNNEQSPVPLTTIQKLLRHDSINSSQIYAQASPETVRRAINNNARNINIKRRYNQKKEQKLEEWLRNSLKK